MFEKFPSPSGDIVCLTLSSVTRITMRIKRGFAAENFSWAFFASFFIKSPEISHNSAIGWNFTKYCICIVFLAASAPVPYKFIIPYHWLYVNIQQRSFQVFWCTIKIKLLFSFFFQNLFCFFSHGSAKFQHHWKKINIFLKKVLTNEWSSAIIVYVVRHWGASKSSKERTIKYARVAE